MSSNFPLQCLFCKHPNPAGASFCNGCGSQLNLQPCDRCGAIDNRTAKHCYKCHAQFSLSVAPELAPQLAPALPGTAMIDTTLNNSIASGLQTATTWRRGKLVAGAAILLALIPLSLNFFNEPFPQLAQQQVVKKIIPDVTAAPLPANTTPSTVAAPVDDALAPTDPPPKLAVGTDELKKVRPKAVVALTHRSPPTIEVDVNTRPNSPTPGDCPPAVASLGLCHPGI